MRKPDVLRSIENNLTRAFQIMSWAAAMVLLVSCSSSSSQASTVEKYLTLEANAGPTFNNGDFNFNVMGSAQSPVDGLNVNFSVNGISTTKELKKGNSRFQVNTSKLSQDAQDHVVTIFTATVPGLNCTPDLNPLPNEVKISCLVP